MTDWTLDGRVGTQVTVDVCTACQSFWFDQHQSLQLSPGSTLKLMKYIGEHSSTVKPTLSDVLKCPRCGGPLSLAHDLVRNMRFNYWACGNGHGKFIGFFDFLKEKNFIHALSPQEIQQLKQNVQSCELLQLWRVYRSANQLGLSLLPFPHHDAGYEAAATNASAAPGSCRP